MGWGNAWIFKEFMKCLIKVEKIVLILHFTQKLNVSKFPVCIDSLNHRNEKKKCSLLATKGQTLGNEHFFAFLPPKNSNRQQ